MKLVIVEGQKDRAEQVVFAAPAGDVAAPSPAPPGGHRGSTQRWLGLRLGAAGLGLGAAFGIVAVAKQSTANDVCPNPLCRTQAGSTTGPAPRTPAPRRPSPSSPAACSSQAALPSGSLLRAGTTPASGSAWAGAQLRLDARF